MGFSSKMNRSSPIICATPYPSPSTSLSLDELLDFLLIHNTYSNSTIPPTSLGSLDPSCDVEPYLNPYINKLDLRYGLNDRELSCLKLLERDIDHDHDHDNDNDNNNNNNKYDANTNINGNVVSRLDMLDEIEMVMEGMINNISKLHDCDEGMGKFRKTQKRSLDYEGLNSRTRAQGVNVGSSTCQDEYGITM